MEFSIEDLRAFQAEPLVDKIQRSLAKIGEWYSYWDGNVYVSFSGGKDSTVLADLCATWCKLIGAKLYLVFVNTGLEYPEIQKHVKFFAKYLEEKYGIEVQLDIVRPKMRFDEVIKTYGYPLISKEVSQSIHDVSRAIGQTKTMTYRMQKLNGTLTDADGNPSRYNQAKYKPLLDADFRTSHMCCGVMKKGPAKRYEKETGRKPIVGTMAEESRARTQAWLTSGCNAFNSKRQISQPMSFWTEQDVLRYIKEREVPIASVYGDIEYAVEPEQMRWGEIDPELAVFETKEQQQLTTTGCSRTGCVFCGFGCHLEKEPSRFQRLKETHPRQYAYCIGGGEYDGDGVWKPNKEGLGMGHVFDELNKLYGDGFIKY